MKTYTLVILLLVTYSMNLFAQNYEEEKGIANIGFSKCHTSYQRSLINIHRDITKRLIELTDRREGIRKYSLGWVRRNFIQPEGRVASTRFKFKNHARTYVTLQSKLATSLELMKSKMQTGFKYYCRTNRDKRCNNGEVQAYVLNLGPYTYNRIYLCPSFLKSDREDQQQTIMHELSHLAADTEHFTQTIFTDEGMIEQANDAYFYEKLVLSELDWVLKRNSWGFLWLKPRE
jgi:hypothetical protein